MLKSIKYKILKIFFTRIPSNLDKAFNGLKALNVRIDLNAGISATPSVSSAVPSTLTQTIRKSNQFHPFVKYFLIPDANHFTTNSMVNIIVNNLSNKCNIEYNPGCCRVFISSNALKVINESFHFDFNRLFNLLMLYYWLKYLP